MKFLLYWQEEGVAEATEDLMEAPSRITETFQTLIDTYAVKGINILFGLIVFFIGYIIAKIIYKVILRVLKTLKLDKLDDKLREVDLFQSMDINLPKVIAKTIYYLILLSVAIVSVEVMGIESLSNGIQQIFGYLPRVFSALLIFIIGAFIANIIKNVVRTATESLNISTGKFLSDALFYFLLIMIGITALNQAGIETSLLTNNLVMIIGAILIAFVIGFGFASRNLMASLLSSFYVKDKIQIGKKVKVGEYEGEVVNMDATSLQLKTESGSTIHIPLNYLSDHTLESFD